MSNFSSIQPDPGMIGGIAQPPYARLPDPATLFSARARRLAHLAGESELKPYLVFLSALSDAQSAIQSDLPPVELPDADSLARSAEHAMPPLDRGRFTLDAAFDATLERLLEAARAIEKPREAEEALARVIAAGPVARDAMVRNVLADSLPMESLAEHLLVTAALQVHFTRLAAGLDADRLARVADGACPCCGGPPLASIVVDWPSAPGARYCGCALCGTLWNHVRVRCVVCGSTKGIGLQEIEGGAGTVKAETCDECRSYVKVMYQAKDAGVEPLADDVASLGLDLLMRDGPYRRGAFNPFLLGY
ncbi:MAG: formate dehydrogenase accessory protein FdhE [Rhizobiales bacterium 17-65-6]|nr:MAG: formate dehydrogenase accessory protein FdhE [Rhizobiales bacterium 12-68-15]OYX86474.1 MAG: formate dehydrogenase accessory protein FdhE [Azorhizobium sp. 32-67-21]OYY09933.1 MAG: formate dehydrogenase accessory protein FdhE [Rhizobiales bacterium 35-68-8]OYZ99232.1 MAG: formate dehydrogenase accessory protein FdhE [Rhizobiales bacterium 17-65-6]